MSYRKKEPPYGVWIGPTYGKSSPKNSRRACLCLDSDTYDVKCCKGHLMQQGIGVIESPRRTKGGAFSDGYSDGFDIVLE
jgi:hypothetical protein